MNLQTNIPLDKHRHHLIDYNSNLLLLGSCFSEHIGEKFEFYKFKNRTNPLGILFHPKAIERLIINAINEKKYVEEDLFYLNEQWHCFDTHSKLSSDSKSTILNDLNKAISNTAKLLHEATHVIITLGTAWAYRFVETDSIVANCHKVPQKKFLKELLSIEAVVESLECILSIIKSINPKCTVVFTVSPVRHLKDGFIENTQSKSHLLAALHQVIDPRNNTFYFPSYELMMDELRDYRFYAEDMIHPNITAINYIWHKFSEQWFTTETEALMLEIETIQKGLLHRPFNSTSEKHQKFLDNLKLKQEHLQKKLPFIQF